MKNKPDGYRYPRNQMNNVNLAFKDEKVTI